MRKDDFKIRVDEALEEIGNEHLAYCKDEECLYQDIYSYVEEYANRKCLWNTAYSLPIIRALHNGDYRGWTVNQDGERCPMPYVYHCLVVCRMLIDLRIPVSDGELDILLAGALCHDVIGHVLGPGRRQELLTIYHISPVIYELLENLIGEDYSVDRTHHLQLEKLWQENKKLALLIKIADCSSIVEQLYNAPVRVAKEYIYQARMSYIPMCIKMKERYPELFAVMGVMADKLRSISEATEILVNRYESREAELNYELIALQDENVRMRRQIRMYQIQ